ncbi:MAG TPA: peroxidase family protein, partial [Variovorax sp.]|nr:peroxidase family protein [Variovorax sp.]
MPNTFAPLGLRTVDGTFNNLMPGQTDFGAADETFPRLVDPVYRDDADGDTFDMNGPGPGGLIDNTDYGTAGSVADADPRLISNLVVDMTSNNPAAVQAFVDAGLGVFVEGVLHYANDDGTAGDIVPTGTLLQIPNVTPDEGLSAPFNSWFTFFGQFFDHGLDLVNKGGNETIFIPLQPDDPHYVEGGTANFMVLTRATPTGLDHTNQTTPFVDQNQTYTSHPSHQVFLREYVLDGSGRPVATGSLLDGADNGLATWGEVKAQARNLLGIELDNLDVLDLPLLAVDPYGKFLPDPVTGFPQIVLRADQVGGPLDPDGNGLASGTPDAPISASAGVRTGHAFLNDIAHNAAPAAGSVADGDDI